MLRVKHVGVAGDRLNAIFREMAKYENPVLCIDEVDALGANRDGGNQGQYVTDIVDQLLQLIDGVKGKSNVVLIGGTNYPWNVDPAIISRMTERVYVGLPSRGAVVDYLVKSLKPFFTKDEGVLKQTMEEIADSLEHISMRDLKSLVNRVSSESFVNTVRANPDNPKVKEFIPVTPERARAYASKIVVNYNEAYMNRLEHP